MTHLEDSKIIDLFFERPEQAIDELDRTYGFAVRRTVSNLLFDPLDAEEIVNDTYLGVWNSIPPYRPASLVSFVCRIARNRAVSRLRGDRALRRAQGFEPVLDELMEFLPSGMDVEADYDRKELLDAINRYLAALDYDDRYLFIRRYWFADSVKQIAAAMGSRENRVSVRLFRLREKLRSTLKKEGFSV